MLAGWRGKIGRNLPEPLVRRMLEATLKAPSSDVTYTIMQLRKDAERVSTRIAADLGIAFDRAGPGLPFTIHSGHWERLRDALRSTGLVVQKLHHAHSNAAAAAWSVSVATAPTGALPICADAGRFGKRSLEPGGAGGRAGFHRDGGRGLHLGGCQRPRLEQCLSGPITRRGPSSRGQRGKPGTICLP